MSGEPRPAVSAGAGLAFHDGHYAAIRTCPPAVDRFQVRTENYLARGGMGLRQLRWLRERYELVLHGVALSIGDTDPLDYDYLRCLRDLAQRWDPVVVSDHLCWSRYAGVHLHDRLPVPCTGEALGHVVSRVQRVQDFLGRRIALQNVAGYLGYRHGAIPEGEFIGAVSARADCGIVIDLHAMQVNAHNQGSDPFRYLGALPAGRVCQIRVAGSRAADVGARLHGGPADSVWTLYAWTLRHFGPVPVIVDRSDDAPALGELLADLDRARKLRRGVCPARAGAGRAPDREPIAKVALR